MDGLRSGSISTLALQPITRRMVKSILRERTFVRECDAAGVALNSLLDNLRLSPRERMAVANESAAWLLGRLAQTSARFVLIGGVAGCAYGAHFATKDLDICHARDRENLRILCGLLQDLNAQFRRLPKDAPAEITPETLCTETDFVFSTPRGDVDLIGEFTAVGAYEQARDGAAPLLVDGIEIHVLSLPNLVAAKQSTGRPKDQSVALELLAIERALGIAHGLNAQRTTLPRSALSCTPA
jgi:hypothetical protein